jgi:O-acetyl-ADP-ribose deacetylase (regulator of RNase III)
MPCGAGHHRLVPAQPEVPSVEDIVGDLRVLRERGLVRLRHSDLPALRQAAAHSTVFAAAGGGPGAVEALLRAAVENLGGGSLGEAAGRTFGLGRGARDRAAADRRQRAALAYGVSVERFRKHHERLVLEQVAEEIVKLCEPREPRRDVGPAEFGRQIWLLGQAGTARFPVIVHTEPVELLSGVDIVVVPQNLYLEIPQHFKSSVAAAVRRAAAIRGRDGEIVSDVIDLELRSWLGKNARPGLPVAAGTVAVTSSGAMADHGIRRVYHAALTSPRPGTNDYDVEPTVIAQVVRNVFATAAAERDQFDPPLSSVGFPLLGAGRGGMDPATSFAWLWAAIEREFLANGPWELHFVTHQRVTAELIVAGLTEAGIGGTGPGAGNLGTGDLGTGSPGPGDLD